jgi:hypothetical protein
MVTISLMLEAQLLQELHSRVFITAQQPAAAVTAGGSSGSCGGSSGRSGSPSRFSQQQQQSSVVQKAMGEEGAGDKVGDTGDSPAVASWTHVCSRRLAHCLVVAALPLQLLTVRFDSIGGRRGWF